MTRKGWGIVTRLGAVGSMLGATWILRNRLPGIPTLARPGGFPLRGTATSGTAP